jgi:hypothetical protein
MAWYKNVFRLTPANILVGVGVALAAPVVVPAVAAVVRPVVKGLVKGSMVLGGKVAAMATEAGEQLSDLYAEARAEHAGQTGPRPRAKRG